MFDNIYTDPQLSPQITDSQHVFLPV